jgi:putative polyhydroxyalkanoate system protein
MTKTVTVNIPHELGKAEARRRIEDGFGKLTAQFGGDGPMSVTRAWEGDRLSFAAKVMGQGITGRLDVQDQAVRMEIDLPNMLAMIAGKIQGRLKKEGQLLLEKK